MTEREIRTLRDNFEYSKEKTDYIESVCIDCRRPIVVPARFSDGLKCEFCGGHLEAKRYVRRKKA